MQLGGAGHDDLRFELRDQSMHGVSFSIVSSRGLQLAAAAAGALAIAVSMTTCQLVHNKLEPVFCSNDLKLI